MDESTILDACALRFNGYKYEKIKKRDSRSVWNFPDLCDRIDKTRVFPDDQLDCLAAFFALQRYLGKWGGDTLSYHSKEHIVFRLLFLHLYRTEIPEEYRLMPYWNDWRVDFQPRREEFAAIIRKTFHRRGRPPKFFP